MLYQVPVGVPSLPIVAIARGSAIPSATLVLYVFGLSVMHENPLPASVNLSDRAGTDD
jgi:hypothetical protein